MSVEFNSGDGVTVPNFEVLTGLPPYGPQAEAFSATGQGLHREGLVVRFVDSRGRDWIGNFQPGLGGISDAVQHPDGRHILVVAGGQGYIVDPNERASRQYFGGDVQDILPVPDFGVLIGNALWFEAIGSAGTLWTSGRISWDGMQGLAIDGRILRGESWDALTDRWVPFELDLVTGCWNGGAKGDILLYHKTCVIQEDWARKK